jgi:hypothetical protein
MNLRHDVFGKECGFVVAKVKTINIDPSQAKDCIDALDMINSTMK